jgi:hypothetical protein
MDNSTDIHLLISSFNKEYQLYLNNIQIDDDNINNLLSIYKQIEYMIQYLTSEIWDKIKNDFYIIENNINKLKNEYQLSKMMTDKILSY